MKKYINIFFSVLITTIALAAVYSVTEDIPYESYERIVEEETQVIDAREFSDAEELLLNMVIDYTNGKKANDNLIAWLNIPNAGYYPIMFGKDNQFYLKHNQYDKYSYAGSIFMNTNSLGSFDNVAQVHGHRMNNGTMFGNLKLYKNKSFFQKNETITVFDGKYFYFYKPYTVFILKDGAEYIKQSGMNFEERLEYMTSLKSRSLVPLQNNINPDLSADMLFLTTCDYSMKDGRLIVGCYRVDKLAYSPKVHGPF